MIVSKLTDIVFLPILRSNFRLAYGLFFNRIMCFHNYRKWSEKASTPYLLTAYGAVAPAILPAILAEMHSVSETVGSAENRCCGVRLKFLGFYFS